MTVHDGNIWTNKGETLSDKSARKEFKITQKEILEAINSGKLQFRENYIYGNPWFRLIRKEVETLVEEKYGTNHLHTLKFKAELKQINKELKKLITQTKILEFRKKEILEFLNSM